MAIPVVTISDHSLRVDQWFQVNGWLSYSDADGDAATKYQFWDSGTAATSGFFWNDAGGGQQPANTTLEVAAADLASIYVRGGTSAGTDTMWVRAYDGHDWSNWDQFTLTTLPNNRPVATIDDHSVHIAQWTQVKNWLSYSDADGDAATKYQFWDSGTAANSGFFWNDAGGGQQPANTTLEVAAADLASIYVRGGTSAGTDTMWVRAFDGHDWGNWDTFTLTTAPNNPPVATIDDHSVHIAQWTQVKNWLSYSDADGDAATKYQFWDSGTAANSGFFWNDAGGGQQPANTTLEVAAANLASIYVRGGTSGGSETMWVRAFDGHDWGNWDQFTFTTLPNNPPIATIDDHSLHINEWAQVRNWLSYSDADGDAATKYQFWDSGAASNSGFFWNDAGGGRQAANTTLEVAAADLASIYVRGGTAAGSETMWVRAFDGHDWGNWDMFGLTTLA